MTRRLHLQTCRWYHVLRSLTHKATRKNKTSMFAEAMVAGGRPTLDEYASQQHLKGYRAAFAGHPTAFLRSQSGCAVLFRTHPGHVLHAEREAATSRAARARAHPQYGHISSDIDVTRISWDPIGIAAHHNRARKAQYIFTSTGMLLLRSIHAAERHNEHRSRANCALYVHRL